MRRHWIAPLLTLVGLAAGSAYALWGPHHYTARAVIRAKAAAVPDLDPLDWPAHSRALTAAIRERSLLTELIATHQLYGSLRQRLPMEEVVAQMRRDIRFTLLGAESAELTFTYPDQRLAWQVASELTSRLMDEHIRIRRASVAATRLLYEGDAPTTALPDALQREVSQRYRALAQEQLVRILLLEKLLSMKLGANLVIEDQPVVPAAPDNSARAPMSIGAAAGLVLGATLYWLMGRRSPSRAGSA